MNPLIKEFHTLFPKFDDFTYQISSFANQMADTSMWKPRDDGPSRIDVNISLYDSNGQTSTSVSFSRELPTESVEPVRSLTETYVRDVEEVLSKESPGNMQTEEESPESGSESVEELKEELEEVKEKYRKLQEFTNTYEW